jgi:hypothetical protein
MAESRLDSLTVCSSPVQSTYISLGVLVFSNVHNFVPSGLTTSAELDRRWLALILVRQYSTYCWILFLYTIPDLQPFIYASFGAQYGF